MCSALSARTGWRDGHVWSTTKVELMVSLPNHHETLEKLGFTGSFYFHPENVDSLWEQLKDKVPIVYPIENFSYGMREFAIRDSSGYILQFGKPIE
jgi:uncharacterized glyoxalase superfamily protein PhnB